jgi:predicted DNA binding protein
LLAYVAGMRYLELLGRPPSAAPRFFRLVADSTHVEEARLLEWNPSTEDALTALYVIDGDADAFRGELDDASVIVEFELTRVDDGRFYLLVVGRPSAAPLFQQVIDAVTRKGLIVATPVVYREGTVRFRIVGPTDVLQSMVEAVPPGFEVEIHEIGTFPDAATAPTTALSERQRAAVTTALELGYYETPREATHADVAERLGCAPNTATEHLQKAEAKLVRNAMSTSGEST